MTAPAIQLENVSFAYPGGPFSLSVPSLEVDPGERLAVVGFVDSQVARNGRIVRHHFLESRHVRRFAMRIERRFSGDPKLGQAFTTRWRLAMPEPTRARVSVSGGGIKELMDLRYAEPGGIRPAHQPAEAAFSLGGASGHMIRYLKITMQAK